MHELGLAQDVLEKVKAEAKAKGIPKVTYAKLKIGESRITDPPEFKEIFSTISAGSVADGMRLELEILPLKAVCSDCKKEFKSKTLRLDCPHCGSTNIQISSGKQLLIEDLK
jgi:hydrogenase nickel incorporation protein HypA/HybF